MRAFICDACGTPYKAYVNHYRHEEGGFDVDVNGISLIRVDKEGKLHGKGKIELCPECMNKTVNYIFNDLVTANDVPFIERMHYYDEKKKANEAAAEASPEA